MTTKTIEITGVQALTDELLGTIDGVKNGDKTLDEANTIANLAGKVVAVMRLRIEYARATKRAPDIAFME